MWVEILIYLSFGVTVFVIKYAKQPKWRNKFIASDELDFTMFLISLVWYAIVWPFIIICLYFWKDNE